MKILKEEVKDLIKTMQALEKGRMSERIVLHDWLDILSIDQVELLLELCETLSRNKLEDSLVILFMQILNEIHKWETGESLDGQPEEEVGELFHNLHLLVGLYSSVRNGYIGITGPRIELTGEGDGPSFALTERGSKSAKSILKKAAQREAWGDGI